MSADEVAGRCGWRLSARAAGVLDALAALAPKQRVVVEAALVPEVRQELRGHAKRAAVAAAAALLIAEGAAAEPWPLAGKLAAELARASRSTTAAGLPGARAAIIARLREIAGPLGQKQIHRLMRDNSGPGVVYEHRSMSIARARG
jgi:hypothetical protein